MARPKAAFLFEAIFLIIGSWCCNSQYAIVVVTFISDMLTCRSTEEPDTETQLLQLAHNVMLRISIRESNMRFRIPYALLGRLRTTSTRRHNLARSQCAMLYRPLFIGCMPEMYLHTTQHYCDHQPHQPPKHESCCGSCFLAAAPALM